MRWLPLVLLTVLAAPPPASEAEARASRAVWEKRIVHSPAIAPILAGDTLWVVGTERRIHSIEAATGKRHWRRNLPGPAVTGIVASPGLLFVGLGSPTRMILALDRHDGKQRWKDRVEGIPAAVLVSGRSVVVTTTDGVVRSYAAQDGSRGWVRKLGAPVAGAAGGEGGRIFVLGRGDSLWCIGTSDGATAWAVPLPGIHSTGPVVVDSLVLSASYDGEVVARRASDGAETARARATSPQIARLSASEGSIAMVASGGEIETFLLPGLERGWERRTAETVSCGATAWGEWWVVPALDGRVLALTRARGIDAWDLKLRASVFLPPAASRDYLALVDERGRVMTYRLDQP